MSSRIKTLTPFIDKDILCRALTAIGCGYIVEGNTIITERKDYYGQQKFELTNGRFSYVHESNERTSFRWSTVDKPIHDFLARVESEYDAIYRGQLEELRRKRLEAQRLFAEAERRRAEAEKRRLEAQKQQAEAERKRLEAQMRQAAAEELRRREEENRAVEELWRQEEERRLAEEEMRRQEEERLWAEEETRRLKEERLAYIEKQRQTVIANAKSQGYDIREERVEDKIKLVLVRTTY
jgi:hypothetical protein